VLSLCGEPNKRRREMKRADIERFVERAKKDFSRWLKIPSTEDQSMTFNVFIKEEDNLFVAHCLELDIVATANSLNQAKKDITSLIIAQIDYAFSNDNLEHLFHPAPQEVWAEFFSCKEKATSERHKTPSIPPWIITNIFQAPLCHA
jgi:hypothetical protein